MDSLFSALQSKSLPSSLVALKSIHRVDKLIQHVILHVVNLSFVLPASVSAIGTMFLQEGCSPAIFMSKRALDTDFKSRLIARRLQRLWRLSRQLQVRPKPQLSCGSGFERGVI